ncbi:ATP-dependent permease MDL1, mitochondrial [Sphaceloma murrayae]|uniref:ATP-dependent permease MDL1, mitochondrial n=1 Tax=Sphaceloma murrayae TaxID=2082308 RepID=A0A2K1QYY5_9PEZI|nr:ATP-dependent permease MDL1, mitochondrial [Sphaceloma murrayae]
MFRPARLVCNYSTRLPRYTIPAQLLHRTSTRSISRYVPHEEPVTVQPVRIRKWWTGRRVFTVLLYTVAVGSYLNWLLADLEIAIEEEEEEEDIQGQEDGDAIRQGLDQPESKAAGAQQPDEEHVFEGDEDAIFIPLAPARKLPREFYKGTDPEWQEFKKFAPDKDKMQKLFKELANIVGQGLAQLPSTAKIMGKDTKVRKYWLDVDFPYGPPQEYIRKGLEIGGTYVALAEQVISQQQYERQARILWPSGTISSIYAFYNTIWSFQMKKIKEAFGLDSKPEPGSQAHRMDHMLRMVQAHEAAQAAKNGAMGKAQSDPSGAQTAVPTGSDSQSQSVPQAEGRGNSSDTPDDSKGKWYIPSMSLGFPGEQAEKTVATLVFANSMRKNTKSKVKEPPRGNFSVTGVLQASGGRASMMFEVLAFYDPKAGKFTLIEVSPRSIKEWKQAPRGGP